MVWMILLDKVIHAIEMLQRIARNPTEKVIEKGRGVEFHVIPYIDSPDTKILNVIRKKMYQKPRKQSFVKFVANHFR